MFCFCQYIVVGHLIVSHTSNTIICSHSFILHAICKKKSICILTKSSITVWHVFDIRLWMQYIHSLYHCVCVCMCACVCVHVWACVCCDWVYVCVCVRARTCACVVIHFSFNTLGSHVISVFGPCTWTDLPLPLWQKPSLDSFSSNPKTFFSSNNRPATFSATSCYLPSLQVPVCYLFKLAVN